MYNACVQCLEDACHWITHVAMRLKHMVSKRTGVTQRMTRSSVMRHCGKEASRIYLFLFQVVVRDKNWGRTLWKSHQSLISSSSCDSPVTGESQKEVGDLSESMQAEVVVKVVAEVKVK